METLDLKQFIIPLISMWLITLLTTTGKGFVTNVWSSFKRLISVSIYIANMHWSYYKFIDLLEEMKVIKNLRIIRFLNGRWGDENVISIGLGTGLHIVRYKKRLLFIRIIEKNNMYFDETMGISITALGRNNAFVFNLREDLYRMKNQQQKEAKKIPIMYLKENVWEKGIQSDERLLNSVFLTEETRDKLVHGIKNFIANKDWYNERGLNYQLGIMLSGPPGTGKTSVIKGLATYFNRSICLLRANELDYIREALIDLPKDAFLVIEDIDSNKIVKTRKNGDDKEITVNNSVPSVGIKGSKGKPLVNLSDILNSFDGLMAISGRIMIITTNHKENIDPALFRPGRIDIDVIIDYVNVEIFKQFVVKFYNHIISESFSLKNDKLTIAQLQTEYLQNKLSYEDLLLKYTTIYEK